MVTFSGLKKTLAVTRNPAIAIVSRATKKRATITFKNGTILRLTWRQFTFFRDNYETFCKYRVENSEGEAFRIKTDKFELVGSAIMLLLVDELMSGNYNYNCQNKIVLDIGGFQGETAVFFSKMGAEKVIIYEPVNSNHQFIKENIRSNNVNAEIHEEGAGGEDGVIAVPYEQCTDPHSSLISSLRFGVLSTGPYEMQIKVKNIGDIIDQSNADFAKIDCEGAEKFLLNVSTEVLGKIEYYIIEVHSAELKKQLIHKFGDCGFSLVSDKANTEEISVVHFQKRSAKTKNS